MTRSKTSKRIVLTTYGSFGDVHPYMAVALELKARGHSAVIATSNVYQAKIEAAGLEFHPVRPEMPEPDDPAVAELIAKVMDPRTGAEYLFTELLLPHLRDAYQDLSEVVRGADYLVTHPITYAGPILAEPLKLNWASSVLAPVSLLSIHDPIVPPNMPWLFPVLRAGGPILNRAFLKLIKLHTRSWFEPVARLRAAAGLPPGKHPVFEGQHSPSLVLAMFSKVLAAPQPDWPLQTVTTGFAFYDKRDETPTPPEFLKFLDEGPPPVIFTLGSSAVFIAGDFFKESIAAAKILGRRAVLLIGDARNMPEEPLPEAIVAFDYAPYSHVLQSRARRR